MKKILISLVFLFCAVVSFAYEKRDTFPNTQSASNAQTLFIYKGALKAGVGGITTNYPDTATASATQLADYAGAIIFVSDTMWVRDITKTHWIPIQSGGIFLNDTIYTRLPIYVDTISQPGKRIISLLHLNGLESGGVVTQYSCWEVQVTPAIYYLNFRQYNSALTILAIDSSDATFARYVNVIVDTFGVVSIQEGTAAASPQIPQINPSSQIILTTFFIPAGAACLPVGGEVVYDGIADDAGQWTTGTSGTLSADFVNTDNPFHLVQDLFVTTYTNGSTITFTKPSGTNTVAAGDLIKIPLYLNGLLLNQIQGQWFNGSTAVSNNIVLNPYFNPTDSNSYQILAVQLNTWNNMAVGTVYNKFVLTFAGNDTSGAKGIYFDYIQIQTGIVNANTQLTLTTTGNSGPATYNNITQVLNIPIYTGGNDSAYINVAAFDSSGFILIRQNGGQDTVDFFNNVPTPTVLDTSFEWSVLDSLSTPPVFIPGQYVEGNKYLVGTAPTGLFTGHANNIATYDSVAAIYTFDTASIGDLLYNATTDFVSKLQTGPVWVRVGRATLHQGGDTYGTRIVMGSRDNFATTFLVNNTLAGSIGTAAAPSYNLSLGILSLPASSTGDRNTALGSAALGLNTTGFHNTGVGYTANYHNTNGNQNTGVGWAAIGWNIGTGNTAVGYSALNSTVSVVRAAEYNTAIGFEALQNSGDHAYNIGLGVQAGALQTTLPIPPVAFDSTLFVSNFTKKMYFRLDTATGTAPSVIGYNPVTGFWNHYVTPSGGGAIINEQQNFYNGEFYWNHGFNTSTGAFTSTASNDVTDYLPVPGNTSITITSTDSSLITIYGWTYDTTLTAISEIRSNSLIGTTLKTYTFTTPSNARYLAIYTKAASDSFNNKLRIISTNNITYAIPITPEQFTGTSQTSQIQQAINFARWTTSSVLMRGKYFLDSAMILSSGTTILCDGCLIQGKYSMQDNIIRNEAVAHPESHIFNRGNRNIKIIGKGYAVLQGTTSTFSFLSPGSIGDQQWRLEAVKLANVENFEISGITLKAPNFWGISLEQSRIGLVSNIFAQSAREHSNQTLIQVHRGSHGITLDANSGLDLQDDIIAIENLKYLDSLYILGLTVYEPYRTNLDIFDIFINNSIRSHSQVTGTLSNGGPGYAGSIRLITADSLKIHDIFMDGINSYQEIFIQDAGTNYIRNVAATVNDVYNLTITNCNAPVYIFRAIKNSSFVNVPSTDSSGIYPTVKPPDGSLNIYRKYYGAQPDYIDSVVASVEYTRSEAKSLIATGQLSGGVASGGNLTVSSTLNTTKGKILFGTSAYDEVNNRLGIGTSSPSVDMALNKSTNGAVRFTAFNLNAGGNALASIASTNGLGNVGMTIYGTGYTPVGLNIAGSAQLVGFDVSRLVIKTFPGSSFPYPPIVFGVGSSGDIEAMRIFSNASVAINTSTDSSAQLVVNGTTQSGTLRGSNAASGVLVLQSTSHGTKGNITFGSGSVFDELNGRLGIGTLTPGELIEVKAAATPFISTNLTGTTSYTGIRFKENGTTVGAFLQIGSTFATTNRQKYLEFQSQLSGGGVSFWTNAGSGVAEKARIDLNGYLGINTDAPTSFLHVNGSFETGYVAKTGTYTATVADHTIEATTGTFTITLPTAVGITGRQYVITNSGTGVVTLATTSSQTFVNVVATPTTLTLAQFNTVIVVSNGANWLRVTNL